MAETKGYSTRQRVIDNCLKSECGYSISEMMELCNHELECQGRAPVTSLNTIRDDIQEISNSYYVEIETIRIDRNKRYRYKDADFSMFTAPLSKRDLANLQEIISSLSLYQGRPQFSWLEETNARVQSVLACHQKDVTPVVGFDENPNLKGKEYFQPIFEAIKDKQSLTLSYKNFRQKEDECFTIHPYYLRQYNKRWFLLACIEGCEALSIFALDRIMKLEYAAIPYVPNTKYDFSAYFDDVIGVSRANKGCVENIRFWVSASVSPYILTKPLHPSQVVIEQQADGVILEIKVIPNYELEQLLLSYGEGIKVLSPAAFQAKIVERIKNMQKNTIRSIPVNLLSIALHPKTMFNS